MDITSLFTNVPVEEAIHIIRTRTEEKQLQLDLPTSNLVRLLWLCTTNIKFHFLNKSYSQFVGVAMLSPLGPVLAGIFLAQLDAKSAKDINDLVLYRRYVEDILVIATSKQQLEYIHIIMNRVHINISVSLEHEKK